MILPVAVLVTVLASCSSGPTPSPAVPGTAPATPAVTPGSVPTSSAVAGPKRLPASGRIEPGQYLFPKGPFSPASFTLDMPAGWIAENSGQSIGKHPNESGRQVGFSVSIVDELYADPCGSNETLEVGTSAQSLADALGTLPGPEVTDPVPVSFGGRPGLMVELTVPSDVDVDSCDPPIGLQIWLDRNANKYFVAGPGVPGRIHIVDVDGGRFVMVSGWDQTAAPEDIAELEAIIESIEFEP